MDSNINMEILLIGAGQLGSRHLQGLLKMSQECIIYVLDPSTESLQTSKQRAEEITHTHQVNYLSNWDSLPSRFDLSIIATNSNIREQITTQLLERFSVSYLILEKVLFQEIGAYGRISELIKQKGVKTWVNHPRRMFKQYQDIKKLIQEAKEPVVFNLAGGNWGLGCNGLHFIDLFAYLTNSEVSEIETDWLDDVLHESKRKDYIEFTGTLKGKTRNNDQFTITSFLGEVSPLTITISSSSNRWLIHEGMVSNISYLSKKNNFERIENDYNMEFQSSLTTRLVNDIFTTTDCDLPTYEEACSSHIPFIDALLKKYNNLTGLNATICPIT